MFHYLIRICLCIIPVLVFLVSLVLLDSFKLVRLRSVLAAIVAGLVAAVVCFFVNGKLLDITGLPISSYSLSLSPLVEEIVKGSYIYILIRTRRIGFLVDSAIFGFAVGTGFAILENLFYLFSINFDMILIWVIRGFGTAIMHGGASAILAIMTRFMVERFQTHQLMMVIPGLALAVVIHASYNHLFISPILSVVALLIVLPVLLMLIFRQSENGLRDWLGSGFDTDTELLRMIKTGPISETPLGEYLRSLQKHFQTETVVDILCLLRLQAELSIQAKGMLLLRERGFSVPVDDDTAAKIAEVTYLEKSIGRTGILALQMVRKPHSRDIWQRHLLTGS